MILVTGGAYAGKEAFIKKTWPEGLGNIREGSDAAFSDLCEATCLLHFECWIRRAALWQKEAGVPYTESALADYLCENVDDFLGANPDIIIELREMGCGIVPLDENDRLVREMVGRVGCHLAERAEEVWKVTMGLAQRIK